MAELKTKATAESVARLTDVHMPTLEKLVTASVKQTRDTRASDKR